MKLADRIHEVSTLNAKLVDDLEKLPADEIDAWTKVLQLGAELQLTLKMINARRNHEPTGAVKP